MRYQIRVRGRLGRTMRAAFPALHAQAQGEDTLLTGTLPDQAALHGVLAGIEALGLELLEVRRLEGDRRESPAGVTPPHPGARNAEPADLRKDPDMTTITHSEVSPGIADSRSFLLESSVTGLIVGATAPSTGGRWGRSR